MESFFFGLLLFIYIPPFRFTQDTRQVLLLFVSAANRFPLVSAAKVAAKSNVLYQISAHDTSYRIILSFFTSISKTWLTIYQIGCIMCFVLAGMAELADALDSGSSESNFMQVQVLFPAPKE